MVLGFHYGWGFFQPEPGSFFAYALVPVRILWIGVDLFFVLSGFLIIGLLLATRFDPNYFLNFFARRINRIVPLYVVMLLLFWSGIALHHYAIVYLPRLFEAASGWGFYAIFLQNFHMARHGPDINFLSVSWSLAVEEQVYLVLPLLVYLARNSIKALAAIFVFSIILAVAFRAGLAWAAPNHAEVANYVLPFARMDAFAAGGLIAIAYSCAWPGKRSHWLALSWACAVIGAFGIAQLAVKNVFGQQKYLVIILFFIGVLMLALLQDQKSLLRRVLRGRIFNWLGSISYGLYLMHLPVLGLCMALYGLADVELILEKPKAITLLALTISLALAHLSYQRFEKPIIVQSRLRFAYKELSQTIKS